jgi:hypothetical protein
MRYRAGNYGNGFSIIRDRKLLEARREPNAKFNGDWRRQILKSTKRGKRAYAQLPKMHIEGSGSKRRKTGRDPAPEIAVKARKSFDLARRTVPRRQNRRLVASSLLLTNSTRTEHLA